MCSTSTHVAVWVVSSDPPWLHGQICDKERTEKEPELRFDDRWEYLQTARALRKNVRGEEIIHMPSEGMTTNVASRCLSNIKPLPGDKLDN